VKHSLFSQTGHRQIIFALKKRGRLLGTTPLFTFSLPGLQVILKYHNKMFGLERIDKYVERTD